MAHLQQLIVLLPVQRAHGLQLTRRLIKHHPTDLLEFLCMQHAAVSH